LPFKLYFFFYTYFNPFSPFSLDSQLLLPIINCFHCLSVHLVQAYRLGLPSSAFCLCFTLKNILTYFLAYCTPSKTHLNGILWNHYVSNIWWTIVIYNSYDCMHYYTIHMHCLVCFCTIAHIFNACFDSCFDGQCYCTWK